MIESRLAVSCGFQVGMVIAWLLLNRTGAMTMKTRKATSEEIFAQFRHGRSVLYRHFIREVSNPRAENGVSHRQHGRSKLRNIDGVPHVMCHGEIQAVTATHYTLDSGTEFVASVKLDSPYLD